MQGDLTLISVRSTFAQYDTAAAAIGAAETAQSEFLARGLVAQVAGTTILETLVGHAAVAFRLSSGSWLHIVAGPHVPECSLHLERPDIVNTTAARRFRFGSATPFLWNPTAAVAARVGAVLESLYFNGSELYLYSRGHRVLAFHVFQDNGSLDRYLYTADSQ